MNQGFFSINFKYFIVLPGVLYAFAYRLNKVRTWYAGEMQHRCFGISAFEDHIHQSQQLQTERPGYNVVFDAIHFQFIGSFEKNAVAGTDGFRADKVAVTADPEQPVPGDSERGEAEKYEVGRTVPGQPQQGQRQQNQIGYFQEGKTHCWPEHDVMVCCHCAVDLKMY